MCYFFGERDGTRCGRVVFRVKVVTVLLIFACFRPSSKYHVAATFANGYLEIGRFRAGRRCPAMYTLLPATNTGILMYVVPWRSCRIGSRLRRWLVIPGCSRPRS